MFIAETYMEEIADHLGMPVEKLREINMYKPNEPTHFKQELKDWHVPLMYQQVLQSMDYKERRKQSRHTMRSINGRSGASPSFQLSSASLSLRSSLTKQGHWSTSTTMVQSSSLMVVLKWAKACTQR